MARFTRARSSRLALAVAILVAMVGSLAGVSPAAALTAADSDPLPGQSFDPAPESRERLVLDHGHIDAFTPVLNEDGSLRLMMKEDVTALNTLRAPELVKMHVKASAWDQMPPGFQQAIGVPAEVYHLPLVQDPGLIWPGWETQLIVSEYPAANTDIVVSEIAGPGRVFLWSQGTFGEIQSLLRGGGYSLPATISQPYPAHTHAAWAFTESGTYTLTAHAEVSSAVNGRTATTAAATYTFVVGGDEALPVETTTSVTADVAEVDPGDPVTLTATVGVTSGDAAAVGAVQFREVPSGGEGADRGSILGHAPVAADGTAAFRTTALPPGEHRIVAEFVPTWSDDFRASKSEEFVVSVSGEQIPKPEGNDTEPVDEAHLAGAPFGVEITNEGKRVSPEGWVGARLVGNEQGYGDWVSAWLHPPSGTGPVWLGWVQAGLDGRFGVQLSDAVVPGEYRLVVKDRSGGMVGWDRLTVSPESGDGGGNGGGGGGVAPILPLPPAPIAPPQECQPPVTLEHGHIDAFTVSVGDGRAVLQIWEDVTGYRVLREPETVLLRVKEAAFTSVPAGVPGGPAGYVLPLAQNQSLIWPGWDTNRTRASGYTDVSINITGVSGPGQVYLYTSQGSFGGWKPILTHGGYAFPGTIHEPSPAHTHAQWVFSEKGIYVFTAHAVARHPGTGASLTTASHTYVFQVGDVPLGDTFCGLTAHGAADAALVNASVRQAEADAIAAAQAENAKSAEEEVEAATRKAASTRGRGGGGAEGVLDALLSGDLHPGVVAGIVGGGVLVLAGIAGGTFWMIRRMGESAVAGSGAEGLRAGE